MFLWQFLPLYVSNTFVTSWESEQKCMQPNQPKKPRILESNSLISNPITGCIGCIYRHMNYKVLHNKVKPPWGLASIQFNNNGSLVPVNKDCQRALTNQSNEDLLLSLC